MKKPDDLFYMQKALEQAEAALCRGEFPVGCVISDGARILADGARAGTVNGGINETDHAEITALRKLTSDAQCREYSQLTLYSTLEPCLMCWGAILISNINRVVYAYEDAMGGGSRISRRDLPPLYRRRKIEVVPDVLRRESLALLKRFFQKTGNTYLAGTLLADYTIIQYIDI